VAHFPVHLNSDYMHTHDGNASRAVHESAAPHASDAENSGLTEQEIEALLVEVTSLATQAARAVKRRRVKDLPQEVVLECLTAIREGRWNPNGVSLAAIVTTMVRQRAIDGYRSRKRAEKREAEFARDLSENSPTWMRPDGELEERELAELRERALASLPPACREAYLLVREKRMTYEEAAQTLGVSPSGISAFVVKANKKLEGELEKCGIHATRWRKRRSVRQE
jgi:RNA polymerase sigma factor (sigma-70 family)